MLGSRPRTVEIDGREVPLANVVRRAGALAIDLCVAVFCAMIAMWVTALAVPLDGADARVPLLAIVAAAGVYLLWARDHVLPSVGRHVFSLRLVGIGRGMSGALVRPLTVYEGPARDEYVRAAIGALVVAAGSLASVYVFADALRTTSVFRTVRAFTERTAPRALEHGVAPRLERTPRSVLIGKQRAYVQAGVRWGSHAGALDFYLERAGDDGGWRVREVREGSRRRFGHFGLRVPDEDVPQVGGE